MNPYPYDPVDHEIRAPLPYSYTWAYLTREIQPGRLGRLRYLGTEWNACAIGETYIAKDTPVAPLRRQGNTWLVRPVTL